jgi:hypothetical protein
LEGLFVEAREAGGREAREARGKGEGGSPLKSPAKCMARLDAPFHGREDVTTKLDHLERTQRKLKGACPKDKLKGHEEGGPVFLARLALDHIPKTYDASVRDLSQSK